MIEASVLILTKDAGPDFDRCLAAVHDQINVPPFEVIVIDSGSSDETVQIAKKYPIQLRRVAPDTFHHARTRNYAASLAAGRNIVFLTQDAIPASRNWLSALLSNFENSMVGAVYGRQLPKPDSGSERQAVLSAMYGDMKIVKYPHDGVTLGHKYYHFSDVNSAIRKEVWELTGFPEDLKVFEDIGIAKRILDSNWAIVYEPEAAVFHSHYFTFDELFKRYFDIGVVYQRLGIWNNGSRRSVRRAGWQGLKMKLSNLMSRRHSAGDTSRSIAQDIGKFVAIELGRREKMLPLMLKRKLSRYKLFD